MRPRTKTATSIVPYLELAPLLLVVSAVEDDDDEDEVVVEPEELEPDEELD